MSEREDYAEPGMPTNWRRVRRITSVLVLLVIAALVVEWMAVPHRYTQEEADRIQAGMTASDVEELMGRPPDQRSADACCSTWKSNRTSIVVVYQDGRVERTVFKSSEPLSFWERWARHLGVRY